MSDAYGIFHLPMRFSHRNGWLPMFDAYGIYFLSHTYGMGLLLVYPLFQP